MAAGSVAVKQEPVDELEVGVSMPSSMSSRSSKCLHHAESTFPSTLQRKNVYGKMPAFMNDSDSSEEDAESSLPVFFGTDQRTLFECESNVDFQFSKSESNTEEEKMNSVCESRTEQQKVYVFECNADQDKILNTEEENIISVRDSRTDQQKVYVFECNPDQDKMFVRESNAITSQLNLSVCKTTANQGSVSKQKKRNFVCEYCRKAFMKPSHLRRHSLTHTGQKDFVCDVCNKAFALADNLNKHKVTHLDQKNYFCAVCAKAFVNSENLRKHQLIHSGQKKHVCDVCSKAFTRSGHLKSHKLIHSDERPLVCPVCNMAFRHYGPLKQHKLLHERELSL